MQDRLATSDQPIVQITSLGQYGNSAWGALFEQSLVKLKVRIVNPGPARRIKVKGHLFSTDIPERDDEQILVLPADNAVEYEFVVPEHYLHPEAQHSVRLTVTDATADGGATLMDQAVIWQYPPNAGDTWDVITGPQPELASQILASFEHRHRHVQPAGGKVRYNSPPRRAGSPATPTIR